MVEGGTSDDARRIRQVELPNNTSHGGRTAEWEVEVLGSGTAKDRDKESTASTGGIGRAPALAAGGSLKAAAPWCRR